MGGWIWISRKRGGGLVLGGELIKKKEAVAAQPHDAEKTKRELSIKLGHTLRFRVSLSLWTAIACLYIDCTSSAARDSVFN